MPDISGIEFLKTMDVAPHVILTTAYEEYALQGYELNVVDYLLKPFSFERFLKAVNRALERLREDKPDAGDGGKILVKADKKLYALKFSEILFLEGQGDYIRLRTGKFNLVIHDTIKNFLTSLPEQQFMRIHKSYVVNLKRIEYVEGNQVRIGDYDLPVSPAQRDELLSRYSP